LRAPATKHYEGLAIRSLALRTFCSHFAPTPSRDAAGLGVPFLLGALAVDRFLVFFGRFRPFLPVVDRVAGVLLVGVGLLLALNYMTILNAYFISLTPQWLLERL